MPWLMYVDTFTMCSCCLFTFVMGLCGIQGASYLWCQRFSACFVLKLPPQRGEGKKWEGVQISKTKPTETLIQEITPPLCTSKHVTRLPPTGITNWCIFSRRQNLLWPKFDSRGGWCNISAAVLEAVSSCLPLPCRQQCHKRDAAPSEGGGMDGWMQPPNHAKGQTPLRAPLRTVAHYLQQSIYFHSTGRDTWIKCWIRKRSQ